MAKTSTLNNPTSHPPTQSEASIATSAAMEEPRKTATAAPPRRASEAALIARCKAALAPLAAIAKPGNEKVGPGTPQVLRFNRAGQESLITSDDIERARRCIGDPAASVADCQAALRPLASLPRDFTILDKSQVVFAPMGRETTNVPISLATIEEAFVAMGATA